MPTYEYECSGCGYRLEKLQSIIDKPIKKCPSCKKMKLERIITGGAGIIYKGEGFYSTDYRKNKYEEDKKKDKKDSKIDKESIKKDAKNE